MDDQAAADQARKRLGKLPSPQYNQLLNWSAEQIRRDHQVPVAPGWPDSEEYVAWEALRVDLSMLVAHERVTNGEEAAATLAQKLTDIYGK